MSAVSLVDLTARARGAECAMNLPQSSEARNVWERRKKKGLVPPGHAVSTIAFFSLFVFYFVTFL